MKDGAGNCGKMEPSARSATVYACARMARLVVSEGLGHVMPVSVNKNLRILVLYYTMPY